MIPIDIQISRSKVKPILINCGRRGRVNVSLVDMHENDLEVIWPLDCASFYQTIELVV